MLCHQRPERQTKPDRRVVLGTLLSCAFSVGLVFAGVASAPDQPSKKTKAVKQRTVSGKVVEMKEYCGGANPSEEIRDSLRKEKPYPNKELWIRPGTANGMTNPVLHFATDAKGNFRIRLPEGDYCIVEEQKKNELETPRTMKPGAGEPEGRNRASDPSVQECLRTWWGTCDKTLKVDREDLRGVTIQFHRACNPPCR